MRTLINHCDACEHNRAVLDQTLKALRLVRDKADEDVEAMAQQRDEVRDALRQLLAEADGGADFGMSGPDSPGRVAARRVLAPNPRHQLGDDAQGQAGADEVDSAAGHRNSSEDETDNRRDQQADDDHTGSVTPRAAEGRISLAQQLIEGGFVSVDDMLD